MLAADANAGSWALVVVTVGALIALTVVLLRQGFPGRLSERQNEKQQNSESRQVDVMERPAGPDAEAMGAAPGQPSTDPEAEARGRRTP